MARDRLHKAQTEECFLLCGFIVFLFDLFVFKLCPHFLGQLGALKMQDRRMQDLKMRDQIAGHENAGPENAGPNRRA